MQIQGEGGEKGNKRVLFGKRKRRCDKPVNPQTFYGFAGLRVSKKNVRFSKNELPVCCCRGACISVSTGGEVNFGYTPAPHLQCNNNNNNTITLLSRRQNNIQIPFHWYFKAKEKLFHIPFHHLNRRYNRVQCTKRKREKVQNASPYRGFANERKLGRLNVPHNAHLCNETTPTTLHSEKDTSQREKGRHKLTISHPSRVQPLNGRQRTCHAHCGLSFLHALLCALQWTR